MKSAFMVLASLAFLFVWQCEPSFARPAPALHTAVAAQDTTIASKPDMLFVVIFALGEAWQKDKPAHDQLYFKEHSANLKRLRQEKKILLGGRYSDKGMILITAENEAAAVAEFQNDPMIANKLFNLELHRFSPFYKGCVED